MSGYIKFLFICSIIVVVAVKYNTALTIQKCKSEDSKCARQSGQDLLPVLALGVPEIGIKPSDPLLIKKIDLSKGLLKLFLKDITVTGIQRCNLKKIVSNVAASKIIVQALCNIDVDGDYEMNGQLIILPVQGKGKTHLKLRKLLLNVDCDMEQIDINGKLHWRIKNYTHSFVVKAKSDLIFENMFNGNELLGQAAREIFQRNWKDLIDELGPPLVKAAIVHVVENANSLFRAYPIEELVLL